MMGGLFRAVILIVIVVAVVVGIGAFFLGYRTGGWGSGGPAPVATSGSTTTERARERGAEIGERVGAAAGHLGDTLSDGGITAKIKSKMALDDTVKASEIRVTTSDKVVTLSGTVASAAERDRALQLARETAGVKSVTNRLRVQR